MKKAIKSLLVAIVALATVSLTSCEGEPPVTPTPGPNPGTETVDLTGTSWVGVYNDTYQNYPAVMTWSLDFTTATEGELFFELTVAGQRQNSVTVPFTWTFDGVNGVMDAGPMGGAPFTYDAQTNTIQMNMMVEVEGDGATLGGMTTFYPRGQEPVNPDQPGDNDSTSVQPGEITDLFPANTRWRASEETVYPAGELGDLPMTLNYEITFRNNHTGFLQVSATVLGQTSDPQSVWFNWEFDNATNTGNFLVQGVPLPFSYDPASNTITSDFSFNVDGTGQQVGGTLTFTQVTGSKAKVRIKLG